MLETFDNIAGTFKRLPRLQDQDIHNKLHNESLTPSQAASLPSRSSEDYIINASEFNYR